MLKRPADYRCDPEKPDDTSKTHVHGTTRRNKTSLSKHGDSFNCLLETGRSKKLTGGFHHWPKGLARRFFLRPESEVVGPDTLTKKDSCPHSDSPGEAPAQICEPAGFTL